MRHLLLVAALLLAASAAQAASITVDGTNCTLADAITAANTDASAGNCPAGSGADTITLQADVTLAAALPSKITAPLIQIESTITIESGGHKIDGNSLGPVLWIASSGMLTLNKAFITGGSAACYCGTNGIMPSGGGMYNEGQLILNNSTVSGNRGDGIHTNMGSLTVNNTTISESKPSAVCMVAGCEGIGRGGGGGIYVSGGGTAILRSSVISGNFGLEIVAVEGTIIADSYNVFGHSGKSNAQAFSGFTPSTKDVAATSDGTKPTALEAILSPLADNGGDTQTYALPAGSPAIDLDAACSAGLTTDQRGYSRPINFKCDAGAVEYSPSFSTACGNGRDLPANTWLMTATSCQPAPPDIGSQYGDDLGGSYGSTWISYKWDAAAQQYPPPMAAAEPLDISIGNWIYSTNAGTLDLSGTATPTEDCASCGWPGQQCFAIDLAIPPAGQSRWNLVGNPFPYAVNWADVRVSSSVNGSSWTLRTPSGADASVMRKTFHRWTGSAYEPKDDATPGSIGILQPQESVWIRTLAADPSITKIKLLIPAR